MMPRASNSDSSDYFRSGFGLPADLYFANGAFAAKRIQVNWPGLPAYYHGAADITVAGGFFAVGRNGADSVGWIDGVPANSPQTTGIPSINMASNGAQDLIAGSPYVRVMIHCLDDTLTDAEVAVLNTAFRNYLTAIGAPLA